MKLDGINLEKTIEFANQCLDLTNDIDLFIMKNIKRGLYRTAMEYLHYERIDFRLQQMVAGLFLSCLEDKKGKLYESISLRYKLENV